MYFSDNIFNYLFKGIILIECGGLLAYNNEFGDFNNNILEGLGSVQQLVLLNNYLIKGKIYFQLNHSTTIQQYIINAK